MQCCYIGKGKVYLRRKGVAEAMRFLGNVTNLTLDISETVKETKDFTQSGGGTDCQVRRIDKVEANMSIQCFSEKNWALAVLGTASAVAAGSIVDEVVTAYLDGFIKLLHTGPYTNVVVTNSAGSTTYVANTDYIVTNGGITIPATGSAITAAQSLKVDYDYPAQAKVEAMTGTAPVMEFIFDGVNEAESDKTVRVQVHKIKFGPVAQLPLITDEFGNLTLKGEVLKDTTITTSGLSQYFVVRAQD